MFHLRFSRYHADIKQMYARITYIVFFITPFCKRSAECGSFALQVDPVSLDDSAGSKAEIIDDLILQFSAIPEAGVMINIVKTLNPALKSENLVFCVAFRLIFRRKHGTV